MRPLFPPPSLFLSTFLSLSSSRAFSVISLAFSLISLRHGPTRNIPAHYNSSTSILLCASFREPSISMVYVCKRESARERERLFFFSPLPCTWRAYPTMACPPKKKIKKMHLNFSYFRTIFACISEDKRIPEP